MSLRKTRINNKGILLLEVLIAIVIITTTLIVINRAFSASLRSSKLASDYLLAGCVLEDKIFDLQIEDSLDNFEFSETVEIGQDTFYFQASISDAEIDKELDELKIDALPIKQAELKVGWDKDPLGDDQDTRVSILTYVFSNEEEI